MSIRAHPWFLLRLSYQEQPYKEEKVSGLFSGELGSEKMQSWEDQNVQMKRVGWITP
jgi:hypothetical protein